MEFRLDRFYKLNRKAIIWIILFGVIYLLRDFFTLIFLTFIISFFAFPASKYLSQRLGMNQSLAVVVFYLAIFIGYIALYVLVLPNVVVQASSIRAKLPSIQSSLNQFRTDFAEEYPNIAWLLSVDEESPLLQPDEIEQWPRFLQNLTSEKPVAKRVREVLPEDVLESLEHEQEQLLENRPRAVLPAAPPGDPTPSNEAPSTNQPPAHLLPDLDFQESLIVAMNQYVLENPSFYQPELFPNVQEEYLSGELRLLVTKHIQGELAPYNLQKLNRLILEQSFPSIRTKKDLTEEEINRLISYSRQKVQEYIPNFALAMLKFFGTSLLAILFSFLIVFDYARLSKEVKGLATSKLRDFFAEAAQPVVKFAISVGHGFQAIATIALITTVMVVAALFILGISSIAFLAVVTFLTSLVPVVGILFEVIPVTLVALNEQGPERALWALLALGIIHVIIGYVITPIIFGRRFKINVVAILIILFIGHQVAGVWGMILGVPVANYLLRDVLGVPVAEDKGKGIMSPPNPAPAVTAPAETAGKPHSTTEERQP